MYNIELIPLIKDFQNGNYEQFDILYKAFEKLLIHYANQLKDDDLLQELSGFLVELLNIISLDKFNMDTSIDLQKYIAVSIRNKYISYSKEKQAYNKFCVGFCEEIAADKGEIEAFENNMFLSKGLSQLTKKQRQIIIYKYIYEYSDIEISQRLNISRQAVNRLKTRALISLRNFLLNG